MSEFALTIPILNNVQPAIINQVARVTLPVKSSAQTSSIFQNAGTEIKNGMSVLDMGKSGLNTLKAENVYKTVGKAQKTVQKTARKLSFGQACKRFKFTGKGKIFGLIAAAGLVTASACGFD